MCVNPKYMTTHSKKKQLIVTHRWFLFLISHNSIELCLVDADGILFVDKGFNKVRSAAMAAVIYHIALGVFAMSVTVMELKWMLY